MFQSLLWWIGLAGHHDRAIDTHLHRMFQSLLWWIGLAGCGPAGRAGLRLRVFQSLLWWIGLAGIDPNRPGPIRTGTVFQSLLWWIGLAGDGRSRARSGPHGVSILVVVDRARWGRSRHRGRCRLGFNPCCGGSGSLGRGSGGLVACAWVFQSLLWWIGLAGADGPARSDSPATQCFNPCCGGSGSLGIRHRTWHSDR